MRVKQFIMPMLMLGLAAVPAVAQLPDAPGRDATLKICTQCHGVENIKANRFDRDGWTQKIYEMINEGAVGTDQEFYEVLRYLTKNFGPNTPTPVKVSEAPASEMEAQLGFTAAEAQAIVTYRTANGPFKSLDELRKVPGVDQTKIESLQYRLVFEQPLAEKKQ